MTTAFDYLKVPTAPEIYGDKPLPKGASLMFGIEPICSRNESSLNNEPILLIPPTMIVEELAAKWKELTEQHTNYPWYCHKPLVGFRLFFRWLMTLDLPAINPLYKREWSEKEFWCNAPVKGQYDTAQQWQFWTHRHTFRTYYVGASEHTVEGYKHAFPDDRQTIGKALAENWPAILLLSDGSTRPKKDHVMMVAL